MRTPSYVFFCAAIAQVRGYLHVCRLTTSVTELLFDPASDTYTPLDESTTANQKNHNTTNARHLSLHDGGERWGTRTREEEEEEDSRIPATRNLGENSEMKEIRFQARYCDCFSEMGVDPFYCPANLQYCGATPGASVGCFNTSQHQEIASNALFVASACLCAVFAWVLLSEPGKHARNFLTGLLLPRWNDRLASHLLREYPERALHMMRLHLRHVHQSMVGSPHDQEWLLDANAVRRLMLDLDNPWSIQKPDDGRRPVALKLKTRIYQSEENGSSNQVDDDDDEEEEEEEENLDDCAICFQDLINGERIGVLVCGHKLHAACLKEWCARRNTCPLCNCNEIAEPQFQNDPQAIAADLRRNLRI